MKYVLLVFMLFCNVIVTFSQQDSVSQEKLDLMLLEQEVKNLRDDLERTEAHLNEMREEKITQYELMYEKMDNRLTNFLWLISTLVTAVVIILSFIGWKAIKKSIQAYFEGQAKKLTAAKINTIITEDWLKKQVEEKAKEPIETAVELLQNNFKEASQKMLEDEKDKMQIHRERAKELVASMEKQRDELEKLGIAQKVDELNLEEKKKVKEYEESLERSKDEKDFTADDWFWKGRADSEEEDFEGAIQSYTRAISLDASNQYYWSNRAYAKNELRKYKDAIKDLDEAIRLDPNDSISFNNRGFAKSELEKYEEAIKDLDEAIRLNAKEPLAFNNRGYANSNLGFYNKAIEDFNKAIELKPDFSNLYAHRGYAYLMINNLEQAEKDNEKAFEIQPDYNRAYYNKGLIKHKQGHKKEACEAWKKALELGFEEAQKKLDEFCV